MTVNLNEKEFKEAKDKQQGFSITSQAFDAARRSFHVKVDFDEQQNISVWLIERGKMLKSQLSVNLKFSSCLCEIEISDPGVKNRKTTLFFSFAHGSNQIVGHKNLVKLD
jgi:hypothetical protein